MKKNDPEYKSLWKGTESRYTADRLLAGETVICVGIGNSMTPILESRQEVVLSKVRGNHYLHLIHAIRGDQYLIGNNHGYMVKRNKIYGKVKEILYD